MSGILGTAIERIDGADKATGRALYVADLKVPGVLCGRMVLSAHAHARVLGVRTRAAAAIPGVAAVLTVADIPTGGHNEIGAVHPGQPLLAADRVRYVGDCLALVAAETEAAAARAAALVEVEYEPLEGVFSVDAAAAAGAPLLHQGGNLYCHQKLSKGDVEAGLAACDVVVEGVYETGHQEHAYLETQGMLAIPEADSAITLVGSMQCPFYVQKGVAGVLGLPLAAVRAVQAVVGGGFGGKEDVPSEIAACAALLAWRTRRPVRLILERGEDIRRSSKRHPMRMRYRLGARRDGSMLAAAVEIDADVGAYATLSPVVLFRSTVHASGPYAIPNVRVDTRGWYTNHPPAGAFRGFGAPQVCFGHEAMVDKLAAALGRDPIDLRLQNGLRPGSATATSQVLDDSAALTQTLERAREASDWAEKRAAMGAVGQGDGRSRRAAVLRGIGVACMHYGVSLGAKGWPLDKSAAYLQIHQDGSVAVAIGGTEMGQGANTVAAALAADALGVPLCSVRVLPADTRLVADSGPTVASRTTVMSGNAVLDAAAKLRGRLVPLAAELLGVQPERVRFEDGEVLAEGGDVPAVAVAAGGRSLRFARLAREAYLRNLDLTATGFFAAPRSQLGKDHQGDAYFNYAYSTQVAEVEVDAGTGRVRVVRLTVAQDIGHALNRDAVEGQVEGGVVQGVGYALHEQLLLRDGQILSDDLSTYILPTATDCPAIDVHLVEVPWPDGPAGAKGVGEPCIIPTAAAIAAAVRHATGCELPSIPLLGEQVWRALRQRRADGREGPPLNGVTADAVCHL